MRRATTVARTVADDQARTCGDSPTVLGVRIDDSTAAVKGLGEAVASFDQNTAARERSPWLRVSSSCLSKSW